MDLSSLPTAFGKQPKQQSQSSLPHKPSQQAIGSSSGGDRRGKGHRGRGRGRGRGAGKGAVVALPVHGANALAHPLQPDHLDSVASTSNIGLKRPYPSSTQHQDTSVSTSAAIASAYAQRKPGSGRGASNLGSGNRQPAGKSHAASMGLFKESFCEDPWQHLYHSKDSRL